MKSGPSIAVPDLALAVSVLRERKASFVLVAAGRVLHIGSGSGIRPLLGALDRLDPETVRGAALADKVVGRAVALIAAHAGVGAVHGEFMSRAAIEEFPGQGITFTYGVEIPSVLNQRGTHLCPFEELVADESSPAMAVERLREGLARLSGGTGDATMPNVAADNALGRPALPVATHKRPQGRRETTAKTVARGGLGLAAAIVLPVAFHAVGIGPAFLPMHVPVLLVGALTTPFIGAAVGLLAPLLSHLLTGMPPLVPPVAPLMALELAAYGAAAGSLRPFVLGKVAGTGTSFHPSADGASPHLAADGPPLRPVPAALEYRWLLPAMIFGRLVLALAAATVGPALGLPMPPAVYVQGAIATGIPGIIAQLILVPLLLRRLQGTGESEGASSGESSP